MIDDVPPSLARRTVLQAGLGAALVLAGVGCSSDADEGATDPEDVASDPTAGDEGSEDDVTPIPQPAAMVRTSWATDPWTLGAYSYLPVGASPDDRTALRAPVDDVLWFAGEAIDPDNPSTVHGAQASGRAAAEAIAETAEPGETVVIVGAGMAGAAAARSLVDAGFEVVVVEARDRTGGRTDTVQPDGWTIPVERGASWIHDTSASDLADQAAALDIATVAFSYDDLALDADGEPMDEDERAAAETALEAAVAWADEASDDDISLADALAASGAADDVDPVALEHFLRTEIATEYGADADELSAWWTFEEGSLGDDLLVTGGYRRLVDHHLDGVDVRLNWPVSTIDRSGDQLAITGPDGARLDADRVVVTVPLGILKADRIAFEPPLPGTHLAAIGRLGMGLLDKVWLRFDEQWWTSDVEQWTRVGDGPDDPYIEWFDIAAATGEPVLLALVGGSTAQAWAERSDDDVLDAAVASLQRFADAGLRS